MVISFESRLINRFYLQVPDEKAKPFYKQKKKRFVVTVIFENNKVRFHAGLQKRNKRFCIMINQVLQKKLHIDESSTFLVHIEEDTSKYGVPMPEELEAVLLTDYEAFQRFEALTPGKQRGLIFYILKIKDTQKRVDKALLISENLKLGITDQRLLIKAT